MERRLASRAGPVAGAVDSTAAGVLGVPVPNLRDADSRGDGGGVDRDAAAEGAVAAAGGAAQAAAGQVSVGPAAHAADAALLRGAPAHALAADAQVRHLPPAAAALLPEAQALSLLGRGNDSLTGFK